MSETSPARRVWLFPCGCERRGSRDGPKVAQCRAGELNPDRCYDGGGVGLASARELYDWLVAVGEHELAADVAAEERLDV